MRRLVSLSLVLAAIVFDAVPAPAVDVRGWRNTTWNMTEPEVRRALETLGLPLVAMPSDWPALAADGPLRTSVQMDGSPYTVTLYFGEDPRRLGRVQVTSGDTARDAALRRQAGLLRLLTGEYGAPAETDARGSLSLLSRWIFKTTTIALALTTDISTRERPTQLVLTYAPSAPRTDERDKLLGIGIFQLLGESLRR